MKVLVSINLAPQGPIKHIVKEIKDASFMRPQRLNLNVVFLKIYSSWFLRTNDLKILPDILTHSLTIFQTVSCSPAQPQTHEIPASASLVMKLQVHSTSSSCFTILIGFIICTCYYLILKINYKRLTFLSMSIEGQSIFLRICQVGVCKYFYLTLSEKQL